MISGRQANAFERVDPSRSLENVSHRVDGIGNFISGENFSRRQCGDDVAAARSGIDPLQRMELSSGCCCVRAQSAGSRKFVVTVGENKPRANQKNKQPNSSPAVKNSRYWTRSFLQFCETCSSIVDVASREGPMKPDSLPGCWSDATACAVPISLSARTSKRIERCRSRRAT